MLDAPIPGRAPWGVAALLVATADALAARFGAVAVRGELSGFTRASSGHCYFSLKDAEGAPALLRCAMFRRAATLLDFAPGDGHQVELRGRLGVYESRGELQMVVESMRRVGEGALYEEFLRRRARLAAEGLFEASRKRPLPSFPQALGIVTSLGAAALHDVLSALQRRAPHLRVVVYPSPVQGAEAPAQLIAALATAGRRAEVDVLLLVRGGGSLEDLWSFNDERLVRAIAACPLPVVCGVGHETDVTLADLVADLRAPTPTAAAELAAPALSELQGLVTARAERAQRAAERLLQRQAQRVDALALRLGNPARALAAQREALDVRLQRLARAPLLTLQARQDALRRRADHVVQALRARLHTEPLRLAAAQARLQAHDPARVLKRGYAWVQSLDGRPVVSVAGLRAGQAVRATWADGSAEAELLRIEPLTPDRHPGAAYNRAPKNDPTHSED
jgi:exodeoxyribonuclease VII large subunit